MSKRHPSSDLVITRVGPNSKKKISGRKMNKDMNEIQEPSSEHLTAASSRKKQRKVL